MNFSKANTKFCISLHQKCDESYLYVNKTEICKFKGKCNKTNWHDFGLGSESKDFPRDEQCEISFNDTLYNFSVDHSSAKE